MVAFSIGAFCPSPYLQTFAHFLQQITHYNINIMFCTVEGGFLQGPVDAVAFLGRWLTGSGAATTDGRKQIWADFLSSGPGPARGSTMNPQDGAPVASALSELHRPPMIETEEEMRHALRILYHATPSAAAYGMPMGHWFQALRVRCKPFGKFNASNLG